MWVYGDIERTENAASVAARVRSQLERYRQMPPGIGQHGELVTAFIECSALVQGVADAERGAAGLDETSPAQDAGNRLLLRLAQTIAASWHCGLAELPEVDDDLALLADTGEILTKNAEGYAFYALYPEMYLEAARRSGLGADTCVIGIRSIGTGLAAMVAAGLEAGEAVSLRPVGPPFERRIEVGNALGKRLVATTGAYAIVDEGPGLSGSSFNGVADWLVAHGVDEERIHFFPSHAGDLGGHARPAHRARWARAQKHVALFLEPTRLEGWIAEALGPLVGPSKDVSGGAWRALVPGSPPADPAMEKRKFLAHTADGKWLAKFAGLGPDGARKLELAQTLTRAGFAPRTHGLVHGFMLTPWLDEVPTPDPGPPRERVLDYLAFRAGLPATVNGASLSELFAMASYNIGQALGPEPAERAKHLLGEASRFSAQPCCTDNRLHRWEWLHGADGWIKLDALDHHAAHDLVGCQDIAWDLAGAAVELDLPTEKFGPALYDRLARSYDSNFVAAIELCYLGFQIGLWTMASGRNGWAEQPALTRQRARYADRLRSLLT